MARLRVELPTVITVLAPSDVCDRAEVPAGATLLRIAPRELMLVGSAEVAGVRATVDGSALVEDVSDAWVSLALEGPDASEAFTRLSELELPERGWTQGEVARAPAKILVDAGHITILVPAMLAAHVEERIRADSAEVLTP